MGFTLSTSIGRPIDFCLQADKHQPTYRKPADVADAILSHQSRAATTVSIFANSATQRCQTKKKLPAKL
jgi:hypothetical protein